MQQVTQLHINWTFALGRSTTYNSARRRSSSHSDCYVTMLKPTRGCQAVGCLNNTDSSHDSERCPPGFPTDARVKGSRGGGVWFPYPKGSDGILLWQRLSVNLMGMWWHSISSSYCIGCYSQGILFFLFFNFDHCQAFPRMLPAGYILTVDVSIPWLPTQGLQKFATDKIDWHDSVHGMHTSSIIFGSEKCASSLKCLQCTSYNMSICQQHQTSCDNRLVCCLTLSLNEHQVIAFVAPKIIGGTTAPTPVGELGMVEMTQALQLSDVNFETVSSALSTFMYVLTVRISHHDFPQIHIGVVTAVDPYHD